MKRISTLKRVAVAFSAAVVGGVVFGDRTLSLEEYRDHMQGAWFGQMVGVSWGIATEFKFNDVIIPGDKVPKWTPERINRDTFGNDDLYVEMTFLRSLEKYGLDCPIRKAGIDFANSQYMLWCANKAGRDNLRLGIAPPASSHPSFNGCPNDIDYQIEADYSGIISPGCPQEVIRLGNVFGRLMNYGDGVWAGQFVGAMYAEAFFTSDVNALLDAGLAAIPGESDYAGMVRAVRTWHRENPSDWTKTWERIRAAYSKKFNPALKDSNGGIDVRLNGAMVVMGLLYGGGDLDRSMEISMRGGYDSDCNPSSVGGILMCARGAKALDAKYGVAIADMKAKFAFTDYDLPALYAVCEKLARQVVTRNGGRAEADRFVIPTRKPTPDAFVPSWKAPQAEELRFTEEEMKEQKFGAPNSIDPFKMRSKDPTTRVQAALDACYPGWTTSVNAPDLNPGLCSSDMRTIVTHPPKQGEPVTLSRRVKVEASDVLSFKVSNWDHGDFRLVVRIDGVAVVSTLVGGNKGESLERPFEISLAPWAGREVTIELQNVPNGWMNEAARWGDLRIAKVQ